MSNVSLDGLNFSGLVGTFELLPSKHTEIGIRYLMTIKVPSRLYWNNTFRHSFWAPILLLLHTNVQT